MLDIKRLREDPEGIRKALARKKFTVDVDAVLALDEKRRTLIATAEQKRAAQKAANGEMAKLPKGSDAFKEKVAEMKGLAAEVKALQQQATDAEAAFANALMALPNTPADDLPDGKGEEDNVVARTHGDATPGPHAIPHWEIPWFEEKLSFAGGTKVTGAGFPFYKGEIAKLIRALLQFFLEENTAAGFVEIMPPLLVNAASATATGQLPDKEGQMYSTVEESLYLIPTSEVPVTNLYRDEILPAAALPLYHTAYSPCFRREAGSWGAHVRGLNRLHQFDKVEVVKWVHPDTSREELESLVAHVEGLLRKLGLPFRTLLMCTGDIGFPHHQQFDLEVFAMGQQRWLEVSSCSNFTDFQARRANIRFRDEDGKPRFVHTLNGSALAIPRVLAAILENFRDTGDRVHIPEVLHRWTGFTQIGPDA